MRYLMMVMGCVLLLVTTDAAMKYPTLPWWQSGPHDILHILVGALAGRWLLTR